jgi:hypothetical protein
VDAAGAAMLGHVQPGIPSRAEVVASQGIVGRFAERPSVYAFFERRERFPVDARTVVFVLSAEQGVADRFPGAAAALSYVEERLKTVQLGSRDGMHVFLWEPPPGVTTVTLP